jgi:PAS domain S-box-containing protein
VGVDELLASENRLKVLLGCTRGIVFEFDREARYLNVWTHDEALLAAPSEKLVGRTVQDVLGDEGQQFVDVVRRVFDTGVPETIEYELCVQGGRRWFVADVIVSPEVEGRMRTVVYLVRDVTAHKQVEEQLRQAQKMEAIGQLVGGVAHNFNNILTTIIGYSEMLLDGFDETSPHHKQATRIRAAAERASGVTKQLLAYGRKRVFVPEVLDANAVITSMVHMLRPLIGDHVELHLDLDPEIGGVVLDRCGLEQVIMNVALNARDAIGAGGTLALRTKNVDFAGAPHVLVVATDTGHGMDDATKARIFEPFFTTKASGKGTGLGLSTVNGIVEQGKGHIEVESELGAGTTFRMYFPRVARAAPQPANANAPRIVAKSPSTILVVEDDVEVRLLVHDHLTTAGYEVVLAVDPSHALELASTESIDMLVTDLVMPKMRGEHLARELRERVPGLRVLYISGYPDEPVDAGGAFLYKPFTYQTLVKRVAALLA